MERVGIPQENLYCGRTFSLSTNNSESSSFCTAKFLPVGVYIFLNRCQIWHQNLIWPLLGVKNHQDHYEK